MWHIFQMKFIYSFFLFYFDKKNIKFIRHMYGKELGTEFLSFKYLGSSMIIFLNSSSLEMFWQPADIQIDSCISFVGLLKATTYNFL